MLSLHSECILNQHICTSSLEIFTKWTRKTFQNDIGKPPQKGITLAKRKRAKGQTTIYKTYTYVFPYMSTVVSNTILASNQILSIELSMFSGLLSRIQYQTEMQLGFENIPIHISCQPEYSNHSYILSTWIFKPL